MQPVYMDLDGKNALVTGSAKRVGRQIALTLAESGANVAIHYRTSSEEATETVDEVRGLGVESVAVKGDLRNIDDIDSMVDEAVDGLGGVDVLVNSAAVFNQTPFGDVNLDDWELHLDVNLRGAFFCAQRAVKEMESGGDDVDGKIVNIADWSGFRPYKNYLPYCISKAGVIALTKGLAKEVAPNITVNAVAPGPVLLPSEFTKEDREQIMQKTPLRRIGSPEDVAAGVKFLLEGSDFITGAVLPVDGGRLIY